MAIDFGNSGSIMNGITALLEPKIDTGLPPVSPILVLTGVPKRRGLSPIEIAKRIITAKNSELGLPIGALPSGGVSPDEKMEEIRVREIINAIMYEGIIEIAIPNGIALQGTGASPAGPVSIIGSTLMPVSGKGFIS